MMLERIFEEHELPGAFANVVYFKVLGAIANTDVTPNEPY